MKDNGVNNDRPKPLPLIYRTITKKLDSGMYETVLFQVFHEDFTMVGTWQHEDHTPPQHVKAAIQAAKNWKK